MMDDNLELFVEKFSNEIEEENAAIFAGAGLSVAAGYVDWRKLLEPVAKKLGLDISQEHDLVSVAQYHCNEDTGGRHGLNQLLINEFCSGHVITENHRILARLPIKTFWTTNYDRLIEKALEDARKIPDVKYTIKHLTLTKAKRNAVVYKMHGDVEHPDEAVLTKDDYEKYYREYAPFITALSGDLIEKTFLFIGFSFTDPNLDYILSRIRVNLDRNQRKHYCIFKKVNRSSYQTQGEFDYAEIKQKLVVNDLKRFHIETLLIDDYSDITTILQAIENRFRQKTVFISGSAYEYGALDKTSVEAFIAGLSKRLISEKHRIVSGFGVGVGSHVIAGALEEIYQTQSVTLHNQLILRPFPQGEEVKKQWETYRNDMIAYAGIAIFIFGNKIQGQECVLADGVRKEFEIAKNKRLSLIPIGATGFMAEQLWEEVTRSFDVYYPNGDQDLKNMFLELGKKSVGLQEHLKTVMNIINKLKGSI